VADDDPGFLRRWSRRKGSARGDGRALQPPGPGSVPGPGSEPSQALREAPPVAAAGGSPVAALGGSPVAGAADTRPDAPQAATRAPAELPTLADVARLTHESDFSRFVGRNVGTDVRNAAMHKLFSDPSFNVMDGLDIYIDDYSKPEPLPAALARQLASANFMNLFGDSDRGQSGAREAPPCGAADDPASDDRAGRAVDHPPAREVGGPDAAQARESVADPDEAKVPAQVPGPGVAAIAGKGDAGASEASSRSDRDAPASRAVDECADRPPEPT
jgi:hypothetical protein